MPVHLLPVDCSDESNGELIEVEHIKVSHLQRQLPPRRGLWSNMKLWRREEREREGQCGNGIGESEGGEGGREM